MKPTHDMHDVVVLAVDDIEDNLDLIEDCLDGQVWAVHRARSGEEALRLATQYEPDVILLDLMMPNMSGFAVLREIRSSEALKDIPVILQTAYTSADNVVTASRAGCDYFLCKPLTKKRLLAEMGSCLQGRPRRVMRARSDAVWHPELQRIRDFATTVADARSLLEAGRATEECGPDDSLDCLGNLIPNDSALGRRLIRLASSSTFGSRPVARSVTEAIVRIGFRETRALIQKASSASCRGLSTAGILNALDMMETLAALFPDRTSTPEGTLTLLEELNTAAESKGAVVAKE
jgi:CheY-like chemotaxis protein